MFELRYEKLVEIRMWQEKSKNPVAYPYIKRKHCTFERLGKKKDSCGVSVVSANREGAREIGDT